MTYTLQRSDQSWMRQLGLQYPIIQAPMAGTATPALAAAVSEAGGMGSLGLGASNTEQARQLVAQTQALTGKAINANLFCHQNGKSNPALEAAWLEYLAPEFARFGAPAPSQLHSPYASAVGNAPLQAMLLELLPAVVSFHFGLPESAWIAQLHTAGVVTMATATSLDEALQIEQAGVQVIVAQGMEAGGHRGCFEPARDELMSTLALLQVLAPRVQRPIVAAGAIMDGNGIAAALQIGACAAQMGTAFILCPESAASPAYRADLQSPNALHTGITAAISGRPARGIFKRLHALGLAYDGQLPDYPITYDAGKALHQAAAQHGNADYAAHWAGQGAPLARALPAAQLMQVLTQELEQAQTAVH